MTHIQILALILLPIPIVLLAFYFVERFWPNAPEWLVKTGLFFLVSLPLLVVAGYCHVIFWPYASEWITWGSTTLAFAAGFIISALWERLLANIRPVRRTKYLFPWSDLGLLLVVMAVLTILNWIESVNPNLLLWVSLGLMLGFMLLVVLCFGFVAVFIELNFVWLALVSVRVRSALRHADYDKALQRVQSLRRRRFLNTPLLPLHSTVLLWAGHHQEAEQLWNWKNESGANYDLWSQADLGIVPSMPENLGYALMGQGRYDEAVRNLEKAISLYPKASRAYNTLAEVYLRQGIQPERALELVEQALQRKRESRQERWTNRYRLSEMWANHAWALALLGRQTEASESLARAFREADRGFKPAMAGLYYRAGQVMVLQGNRMTAVEHLSRACQLDPQGNYGRLAASALREMGLKT